jgi:hypothetical protein
MGGAMNDLIFILKVFPLTEKTLYLNLSMSAFSKL